MRIKTTAQRRGGVGGRVNGGGVVGGRVCGGCRIANRPAKYGITP